MLHVLQYLVGTSMAAVDFSDDRTRVQSVVGGPSLRGSSFSSTGGKRCKFRGRTCLVLALVFSKTIPSGATYPWVGARCVDEGRHADIEKVGKGDGYRRGYVVPDPWR